MLRSRRWQEGGLTELQPLMPQELEWACAARTKTRKRQLARAEMEQVTIKFEEIQCSKIDSWRKTWRKIFQNFIPSACEDTSELGYSWQACLPAASPAGIWLLKHHWRWSFGSCQPAVLSQGMLVEQSGFNVKDGGIHFGVARLSHPLE